MASKPDRRIDIAEIVERERERLLNFVRRRVPHAEDVEDIVQEVFFELVEANRRLMPIDHVSGWMYQVARNRVIDFFRRRQPERLADATIMTKNGERLSIAELLPSHAPGPDAEHARRWLVDEFERALSELSKEQRDVFVAHEVDGVSFKQMAATTGVNINTLLARKRQAVLHLRERLQRAFDEFNAFHER
jgi:RNA polymerase sigma factor (sigma-70 family)